MLVFNDASPAAIAENDRRIVAHLAAFPTIGGTLELGPGAVHISQPIENPIRIQDPPGAPGPAPINFAIVGQVNSRIVYHGVNRGAAIRFAPTTPALYRWQDARLQLKNFTVEGGGVEIFGGGKLVEIAGLECVDADVGLSLTHFDGGAMHDVKLHHCRVGLRMHHCHQVKLDNLRPRENKVGWEIVDCGSLCGDANPEGNAELQMSCERLQASNLHLWLEDTGRDGQRALMRMRHCEQNIFSGVDQSAFIDADPISRLTMRWLTDAGQFPRLGQPVGALQDFAAYGGRPLFGEDGTTAICKPGCFDQDAMLRGGVQGELRGFDPNNSHAYAAGDYAQVTGTIVVDDETYALCAGQPKLLITLAAGSFQAKRNVILVGTRTPFEFHGSAAAAGKGLRLFVTAIGKAPQPKELRFRFENVVVRHLNNQAIGN